MIWGTFNSPWLERDDKNLESNFYFLLLVFTGLNPYLFWAIHGSETPDTLREHDVTHWQKTVNCWDIARFMWIDHLFIPAMLCQQRCVRKSHTHGKNGCVRRYAAGTGVANALKVVQRQCDFISVWEMHFTWFHIQEEKKFQCASLPLCADVTLGQIWSYLSTYFTNESDFPHH